MVISSKQEFYTLYNRGCLGNRLRQWSPDEFMQEPLSGLYVIRIKEAQSTLTRYGLGWSQALEYMEEICRAGKAVRQNIQFNELAPDHLLTCQGEIVESPVISLVYSCTPGLRMREAMDYEHRSEEYCSTGDLTGYFATGILAKGILRHYMDPNSYEWAKDLLDSYPGASIEFSCYSRPLGDLHWNTIFWEVRTTY